MSSSELKLIDHDVRDWGRSQKRCPGLSHAHLSDRMGHNSLENLRPSRALLYLNYLFKLRLTKARHDTTYQDAVFCGTVLANLRV
eukprot:33077-Rhodomonas_salina.8